MLRWFTCSKTVSHPSSNQLIVTSGVFRIWQRGGAWRERGARAYSGGLGAGMSGMAQTASDSILGVIRQESWILDYFEIFVTIALKGV